LSVVDDGNTYTCTNCTISYNLLTPTVNSFTPSSSTSSTFSITYTGTNLNITTPTVYLYYLNSVPTSALTITGTVTAKTSTSLTVSFSYVNAGVYRSVISYSTGKAYFNPTNSFS